MACRLIACTRFQGSRHFKNQNRKANITNAPSCPIKIVGNIVLFIQWFWLIVHLVRKRTKCWEQKQQQIVYGIVQQFIEWKWNAYRKTDRKGPKRKSKWIQLFAAENWTLQLFSLSLSPFVSISKTKVQHQQKKWTREKRNNRKECSKSKYQSYLGLEICVSANEIENKMKKHKYPNCTSKFD